MIESIKPPPHILPVFMDIKTELVLSVDLTARKEQPTPTTPGQNKRRDKMKKTGQSCEYFLIFITFMLTKFCCNLVLNVMMNDVV